jgi:hypothetical protein
MGPKKIVVATDYLEPDHAMLFPTSISCVMVRAVNGSGAAQTQNQVGIDGHSLGKGMAFSAVAPSQQPVCEAHRSNIREWYCPQARIAGHSTSQLIVRFQPAPRLSVGETALGYECGALATYRPVSCASTSTICRCITAFARRYSQLAALPLDPSELSSRCRCCFHGHSHHNTTGSLNP